MINVKFKVGDLTALETQGLMLDYWNQYKGKPSSLEFEITGTLKYTEKEWLNKLMKWVYKTRAGMIVLNGQEYEVKEFVY